MEASMQRSINLFTSGCANFGLIINPEKMVITHQPTPDTDYREAYINIRPGLWPATYLRLESSGILTEQQSQDVEDVSADEVTHSGGYLDRLREPIKLAEPLPPQPPPQNAKVEMAGLDSGHGNPPTDRNPERPGHVEATADALERPPREDS
nr:unnamed protein product [Spirometra erinaceieuropaei]